MNEEYGDINDDLVADQRWEALKIWYRWYMNMSEWKLEKISLIFLLQVCLIAFSCAIRPAQALVEEKKAEAFLL